MTVAVLGKSSFNGILKEQLLKEGLNPVFLENIDEIKSISGQAEEFLIRTQNGTLEAGYIVAAGEPPSLYDIDNNQDNGKPVVFLLDYPRESPAYMTGIALTKAIKLAGKQKKVFCLSRFMRISGSGMEALYKKARNSGAVFIRYNKIEISRDIDSGVYRLKIRDEYDEISIETYALIKTDDTAYSAYMTKLSKLLRLKLDKGKYVSGSSYFLSPSITSRKGIYILDGESAGNLGEDIIQQIRFTVSEINAKKIEQSEYAVVDPGKCAFCYTCYRVCPHSAMVPDYGNSVMKNLSKACQTCGICVSVCPADAIEIKGRNPAAEDLQNSIMIYCCENSGEIAIKKIACKLSETYKKINFKSVFCGGEITAEKIIDVLKSYDKVMYVTCMDDACRHFDGNKRARLQTDKAREMLKSAGLDENRIVYLQVSHAMPEVLQDSIRNLVV